MKEYHNAWCFFFFYPNSATFIHHQNVQNIIKYIYVIMYITMTHSWAHTPSESSITLYQLLQFSLSLLLSPFLFNALQSMPSHSVTQAAETRCCRTPPPGESLQLSALKATRPHFNWAHFPLFSIYKSYINSREMAKTKMWTSYITF